MYSLGDAPTPASASSPSTPDSPLSVPRSQSYSHHIAMRSESFKYCRSLVDFCRRPFTLILESCSLPAANCTCLSLPSPQPLSRWLRAPDPSPSPSARRSLFALTEVKASIPRSWYGTPRNHWGVVSIFAPSRLMRYFAVPMAYMKELCFSSGVE